MSTLVTFLSGKKTYALMAVAVILTGLHALGYINDAVYNVALTVTGAGAVVTTRAAITKSGPPRSGGIEAP